MTMAYNSYIGIDPGKLGAIVVVVCDHNNVIVKIEKHTMPVNSVGSIDVRALDDILTNISSRGSQVPQHCILENVHAIPGAGAKSNFSFGFNCGIIFALLTAHKIPYTTISPKVWQKEMWAGIPRSSTTSAKNMSLEAVKRLFPHEDLRATTRSRTPHDGLIDALLIAEFCRRKR